MKFATKKDLIKKYTEKRKVFTDEKEVEDILNSLLSFIVKKLSSTTFDKNYAYNVESFCDIYENEFDIKSLLKNPETQEFRKAENMLHELILKPGKKKIILNEEYDLKNSFRHRI